MAAPSAISLRNQIQENTRQSLRSLYSSLSENHSLAFASSKLSSEITYSQAELDLLLCGSLLEEAGLLAQEIRFARNATLPLWRLPNELLHHIFVLALPDADSLKYHRTLSIYRSVCLTWQRFIDAVPAFWAVVSCMMDSRALDTALARSQNIPLHIHCDCPCALIEEDDEEDDMREWCTPGSNDPSSDFWFRIKKHLGRWSSLTVAVQAPSVINRFLGQSCGSLKSLTIGTDDEDRGEWSADLNQLFNGTKPKLHHISIGSYRMLWDHLDLSQLRSLVLGIPEKWPDLVTPAVLSQILQRSFLLHSLEILGGEYRFRPEDYMLETPALPTANVTIIRSLTKLTLKHIPSTLIFDFIRLVNASAMAKDIECDLDFVLPRSQHNRYLDEIGRYLSGASIKCNQVMFRVHGPKDYDFSLSWGGVNILLRNVQPRSEDALLVVSRCFKLVCKESSLFVTHLILQITHFGKMVDYAPLFSALSACFPSIHTVTCRTSSRRPFSLLKPLYKKENDSLLFPLLKEFVLCPVAEDNNTADDETTAVERTKRMLGKRPNCSISFLDISIGQETFKELTELGSRVVVFYTEWADSDEDI